MTAEQGCGVAPCGAGGLLRTKAPEEAPSPWLPQGMDTKLPSTKEGPWTGQVAWDQPCQSLHWQGDDAPAGRMGAVRTACGPQTS